MAKRLAAVLLLGAPAAPASAQQDDIVVTGRGLDTAPGDRAFDVVTIDRDRIAANAGNRLENVLADVAGLQQFRRSDSRSANPTSQGITLRGIGGNASSRALLLLDGVPQADPFGGWVAFPAYATSRLGQARVTRGGGSGYQGPGALAGTVELNSATPADLTPFEARAAYGSRDALDAQGSAALVRDNGFATLSASYARGDGFVPTVRNQRGPVDMPAPYEQASVALRNVVAIGADTELQVNASAFTDRRTRGTAFTANKSEGADASLRLVGRGRWGWSALGYLQTRAFASSFASIDAARTTASQTLNQYNVPATGLGGRIEVQPPLGDRATLRVGADIRGVTGKTQELFTYVATRPTRRREAGGNNLTYGLFGDASAELGQLTLSAGGRVDWWAIEGGRLVERPLSGVGAVTNLAYADRHGTETTGRAGVAWRPTTGVTIRTAAYRGWRLPTLNELYRPFRVGNDVTIANPLLTPEELTGYEGGVTLTPIRGASIAATLFHNRLENAIANVTLASTPTSASRVRRNLDAIVADGIEVDARYDAGPFAALISYSHVDSTLNATGAAAALDGLRPAQTPRDQASATLAWRRRGAALSMTGRYVARQFDDDQNSRSLAPATTLDAYAALPVARGLVAELRGENLTDARVEAGISGPGIVERATPRTLWAGLRYSLK